MIKERCFTYDWMISFRKLKDHRLIQINILEKMIYALHLLELLKYQGLDFVFKGGTSLLLLLDENNRFSIDLDIICQTERDFLNKKLNEIVAKSNFISVSFDEKRSFKNEIPKVHYAFEFNSVFHTKAPDRVILDVLVDDPVYPEYQETTLTTKWIETDEIISITTPTIDAITGDKLTAFAPNTIGIPYFKGDETFALEICKQLFDLSRLFEKISRIEIVAESFRSHALKEISYRNKETLTPDDVLRDTIETCLIISRRDANKQEPARTNFFLLKDGVKAFGSGYLMAGKFRIEDAVAASARIAYLAAKLLTNDMNPLEFYNGADIQKLNIKEQKWNFLNRLKRMPDKSVYYYWYKTVRLLTTVNYE